MTIVSTKEFDFDMALRNDVIVQKGDNMFIVQKLANDEPDIICEPDDDFYRSITMNELLIGVKEDLREIFRNGKK